MFVRRLVSGVRSSCDASATSWRCARVDSSSAAEHRVEARREPAQLVAVRSTSIRSERSPVTLTRSAVSVSRVTGRERGARDEQPEHGRDGDPARRDEQEDHAEPLERLVDLGQRSRDLHGRPRSRTANVKTRRCCPLDVGVRPVRVARRRRATVERPLVDRAARSPGAADAHVSPSARDELDVARLAELRLDREVRPPPGARLVPGGLALDLERPPLERLVDRRPQLVCARRGRRPRTRRRPRARRPRRRRARSARGSSCSGAGYPSCSRSA